jgi:pimeloyl-ACP methyl ester carboxylesterase
VSVFLDAGWHRLSSQTGSVEGRLHLPSRMSDRVVIFQPGFPGGSASDFERWHVPDLVAAGNAVFVIRHNATILDGNFSSTIIDCEERLSLAKKQGEKHLGGRSFTLQDWLSEPMIACEALAPQFKHISLVAHSFGAVCCLWSLTAMAASRHPWLQQIDCVISIAGALGRVRSVSDPQWHPMIDTPESRQKVRVGSSAENLPFLQGAYGRIHELARSIPRGIHVFLIHPLGDSPDSLDEVISVQEPLDMLISLGRGTLIIDKSEKPDPAVGVSVHDMSRLRTSALMQLLHARSAADMRIVELEDIACELV